MSRPVATASTLDGALRAPSPPAAPLLGHAPAFQRDPLGFLQTAARTCGPVARLKLGPFTYHLVSDPALVAAVLQERAGNYLRDTRSSRRIRLLTGESLLTSEGETWRRHRQTAQPVFHQRRMVDLARVMAEVAREAVSAWEAAADASTVLDLAAEMSRITFTVVGRCLFGAELGDRAGEVERAFPVLLTELFARTQEIASWPWWLPLPRHVTFKRAMKVIDGIVDELIAERRRRQPQTSTDLLGLLMAARDDAGVALTDEDLRNQVVTFLLAGHETTASALTWAFGLLAQAPEEQRRVEVELDRFTFGAAVASDLEALPKLVQVTAVLQETLRLYPSIWIAERRVVAADNLGGFAIPRGSSVVVSPFVTHRLPTLWIEPDAFRPGRFLDGEPRTLARHGYFPFGAGPHACIGQHFALMEAKILLATLSANVRIHLVNGALPAALGGITLRVSEPVPVRLERRRR